MIEMTPKKALAMARASLRAAPAAVAAICIAASLPAAAQSSEWIGRTVGENAAKAAMGNNATGYAGTAVSVLMGEMGASVSRNVDTAKREQSQDDAVRAQARRDVIYQAELMKQAQAMGVPYERLAQHGSQNAGWLQSSGQVSAFDNLQSQMDRIYQRQRPR